MLKPVNQFEPGKPLWWQWPTILSLDAPAVAIAWQWLFSRVVGTSLNWYYHVILGTSVWLAYAADRWFEGWLLDQGQSLTQRHWFYQRHRWLVFAMWCSCLVVAVTISATHLSSREFWTGIIMLVPVLLYLLSHQFAHRHHHWRVPKELYVALLFVMGSSCFVWAGELDLLATLGVPMALFGLLCFSNCALISIWESNVDQHHGRSSLTLQYPGSAKMIHALPWVIAVLGFSYAWWEGGTLPLASACVATSGLLLGWVNFVAHHHGRELARVLADTVLLTPLLAWWLLQL